MKKFLPLLFLFFSQFLWAQSHRKKLFPHQAIGLQFAGSIGWINASYFRQSANEKMELGMLYGYTPEFAGGKIHALAIKFIYQPFLLKLNPRIYIEPLQIGTFISKSFGKNLFFSWPEKYYAGYYWWINSTRFHAFFSSQASYVLNLKNVQKVSFYFETNTNDLYLFSYGGNNNSKSLTFSSIFFFGIGTKVYLK